MALGDYMGVNSHACIGGTNVREDQKRLEMGVHVIVGTPGRVHDMINRRSIGIVFVYATQHIDNWLFCIFLSDPSKIKIFVLDEADEMLSRGFKDQIHGVFQYLPQEIQVGFHDELIFVFVLWRDSNNRLFFCPPQCRPRYWKWRHASCEIQPEYWWKRKSWPWRVFASSSCLLTKK